MAWETDPGVRLVPEAMFMPTLPAPEGLREEEELAGEYSSVRSGEDGLTKEEGELGEAYMSSFQAQEFAFCAA